MKLLRFLKNILNPLPNPRREVKMLCALRQIRLSENEVSLIVHYIIDELQRSREYGFYIKRDHVVREELFFLLTLEALGGIAHMQATLKYEKAFLVVSNVMWKCFERELKFYFERSKRLGEDVRNKYDCHLESVCSRLLREVYAYKV
jgi:hypothetical protein